MSNLLKIAIEIVDLPIKNSDVPSFFGCLPEGMDDMAPCLNPPAADERCGNVAHRCAQSHRALSAPAHSDRSQFGNIETVSWIQQFKDVECNIQNA